MYPNDTKLKDVTRYIKPALARPRPPIRSSIEYTNGDSSVNVIKLKAELNLVENINLYVTTVSVPSSTMSTISNSDNEDIEDMCDENLENDKHLTPDFIKEVVSNISMQESMNSWYDTSTSSSVQDFQNMSQRNCTYTKQRKCTQNDDTKNNNVCDSTSYGSYGNLLILIAICVGSCAVYTHFKSHNDKLVNDLSKDNVLNILKESMKKIQVQFPNQEDKMWKAFLSQVEEVINESTNICTVILLGNETNTINCLAQLLGEVSSVALGSNHYLTLKAINAESDHGHVVQWLKMEIQEKRVVVVEDLQSMSPAVVRAFHYLCDKENPLVVKAVYIITIIASEYEGIQEDKFVEKSLRKRLSTTIEDDVLDPLIARIMDGPIVRILPEVTMNGNFNSKTCSLDKNSFHTI